MWLLARRRVLFNLTPLLDMLIIIIFAQYFELQSRSVDIGDRLQEIAATTTEREARHDQLREELDQAVAMLPRLERELDARGATIRDLREERNALEQHLARLESVADHERQRAARDLAQVTSVMQDVLNLPIEAFSQALNRMPPDARRRVREELEDLRGVAPERVVRHLRTVSELKKYADFWDVHVNDDDTFSIRAGRRDFGPFVIESPEQVIETIDRHFLRETGEPKSLVVILFSQGKASRAAWRDVERALERLAVSLRDRYDGAKRFEIADLGYTPVRP